MFAVVTVTDRLGLMLHGPAPGDFECVYAIIGGCENPQMRQCGCVRRLLLWCKRFLTL